jgi:hypothetical protein
MFPTKLINDKIS